MNENKELKKSKINQMIRMISISLLLTILVNLPILYLCNKLGFEGNNLTFAPIVIYSLFMFYNLLKGNVEIFNNIYVFISSLINSYNGSTDSEFNRALDRMDNVHPVRTLDFKKSKVIYLFGNIIILCILYYLTLTIICKVNLGELALPIIIGSFVLSLIFPLIYAFLYQTLDSKMNKTSKLKIVLILLLIIVSIILIYFKINITLTIIYFLLFFFFVLTIGNKKGFTIMLIILILSIVLPIIISLLILYV